MGVSCSKTPGTRREAGIKLKSHCCTKSSDTQDCPATSVPTFTRPTARRTFRLDCFPSSPHPPPPHPKFSACSVLWGKPSLLPFPQIHYLATRNTQVRSPCLTSPKAHPAALSFVLSPQLHCAATALLVFKHSTGNIQVRPTSPPIPCLPRPLGHTHLL